MNLHSTTLSKLKNSQELIDVYRDDLHSDECLTGVILDYSDDFMLLGLFTDEGMEDGIGILYREDITRVRWGGNELTSIKELISFHQMRPLQASINLTLLKDVLVSVQNQFGYVCIHTERMNADVCFIGEIEEMDEHALILNGYGTKANRDRKHLLIALEKITRIDAGAVYEKSLQRLYSDKA
ncbi:hypothetical protein ACO0LF_23170 [Undibacterium sp. Di27W]|uniref:hypothetical protein n=1 Tax=Undibacterium sp. Di27W TaxID=3413036 RepID=UPI003BF19BCD